MEIYLIRHLMTQGNLEKRYIGTTDEPLVRTPGQDRIARQVKARLLQAGPADALAASPMKRCLETARLYFGDRTPVVQEKLRETDFGLFENRTYEELKGLPQYQEWMESKGTLPFPKGEGHMAFMQRCLEGFEETAEQFYKGGRKRAAFVIHGGVIMAILSQLSEAPSSFYDWHVENGEGFRAWLDEKEWGQGMHLLREIVRL